MLLYVIKNWVVNEDKTTSIGRLVEPGWGDYQIRSSTLGVRVGVRIMVWISVWIRIIVIVDH